MTAPRPSIDSAMREAIRLLYEAGRDREAALMTRLSASIDDALVNDAERKAEALSAARQFLLNSACVRAARHLHDAEMLYRRLSIVNT